MRKVRVDVTAEDIKLALDSDCTFCPLDRALTRALGRECQMGFDKFWYCNGKRRFSVPLKVEKFVSAYDAGRVVNPFSFELELS